MFQQFAIFPTFIKEHFLIFLSLIALLLALKGVPLHIAMTVIVVMVAPRLVSYRFPLHLKPIDFNFSIKNRNICYIARSKHVRLEGIIP